MTSHRCDGDILTLGIIIDAPWLGMSYCNGTSNEWALCDQEGHPGTLEKPDPCYCPKAKTDRTMTLSQLSTIGNTASLPTATGLSVQFMAGYYPTTPPTTAASSSAPSSTSSSPSSSALVNPTAAAASPSEAAPFPQGGLSRSATIGAVVGASVGGLIVLALCLAPLLVRRRRREAGEKDGADNNNTENPDTIGVAYGGAEQVVSPHPSELEAKAARPWSMVSELEGDGAGSVSPVRMEAIMEQGWGRGEGGGAGPSELPAHHVVELPA